MTLLIMELFFLNFCGNPVLSYLMLLIYIYIVLGPIISGLNDEINFLSPLAVYFTTDHFVHHTIPKDTTEILIGLQQLGLA